MERQLTPKELGAKTLAAADMTWLKLRALYPSLPVKRPIIKYNNRLKTTAGVAYYADVPPRVELSTELLWEHTEEMLGDTLPHELAHCAAYKVFGDEGHGLAWKSVMRSLGLEPTRQHNMVNSLHAARRARIRT